MFVSEIKGNPTKEMFEPLRGGAAKICGERLLALEDEGRAIYSNKTQEHRFEVN